MKNIKIFRVVENATIPTRASDGAVGYDVYAARVLDKQSKEVIGELPVEIPPGESVLIGIGVIFALPGGYQCEIRPRSGLASRHNIELSNSPGTVDPDFRGEVGCLLRNRGTEPFTVEQGMRIAQLVFTEVEVPVFQEVGSVDDLPPTRRGSGGFGFTGMYGEGLGTDDYNRAIRKLDRYFMKITLETAALSECVRGVDKIDGQYARDEEGELVGQERRFGCIIAQGRSIIASGFNFQYPGSSKCADAGCLRDELKIPSGTQLEMCRAVHAEQAAILDLASRGGVGAEGSTVYINTEPCIFCAKLIVNLSVEAVVMLAGVYPTNGIEILKEAGISIRYVEL